MIGEETRAEPNGGSARVLRSLLIIHRGTVGPVPLIAGVHDLLTRSVGPGRRWSRHRPDVRRAAIEDVHFKNGDVCEQRRGRLPVRPWPDLLSGLQREGSLDNCLSTPVLRWSGGAARFVAEQPRIGYHVRQIVYWLNQLGLFCRFLRLQAGSHEVGNSPEAMGNAASLRLAESVSCQTALNGQGPLCGEAAGALDVGDCSLPDIVPDGFVDHLAYPCVVACQVAYFRSAERCISRVSRVI
jgi:hypothetical protein